MMWLPLALTVAAAVAWVLWTRQTRSLRGEHPDDAGPDPESAERSPRVRALAPLEVDGIELDDLGPDTEGEALWIELASTDVADGCFMVELDELAGYVTLWTHRAGEDRKVSYLRGRDNTAEYVVVGRVYESGVRLAPAYAEHAPIIAAARQLFDGRHVDYHERFLRDSADYAQRTGCCGRCGHPISNSLSVWRGLGSECFTKAGRWHLC